MEVPTAQELESLKYLELQRLAKAVGLKANLKADRLLKSLRQHFNYEAKGENAGQDTESSQSSFSLTDEDDLNSSQEKDPIPEAYVTKRRGGRGRKADKIPSSSKVEPNDNTVVTDEVQPSEENQETFCEDQQTVPSKDTSKKNRKRSRPEDLEEQTAAADQTNETITPGGKIPRYIGRLKSVKNGGKPTTPNFKKLHEAHFKKMESIDTFVERNRKRLEALANSNPAVKTSHSAKREKDAKIVNSCPTEKQMFTENLNAEDTTVEPTVIVSIENHHMGEKVSTPSEIVPRHVRRPSKTGDARMAATTPKVMTAPDAKSDTISRKVQKSSEDGRLWSPDLRKLKESHIEKMSLLDEYLERKRDRLNAITNSIKEVKILTEKKILLKQISRKMSVGNSTIGNSMSLFSPLPTKSRPSLACTPGSQRRSPRTSVNLANLSLLNEKVTFKPSILSSSKMNVRFSETTKDNENKQSLTKTPARRSPYVQMDPDTPSDNLLKVNPFRKSLGKPGICTSEKLKTEDITPFKFQAEKVDTPATNKKNAFDIKASLAKPLGYEPHKGKLKPWGENENPASVTKTVKPTLSTLKKEYKQPRLQTRETRRDAHVKGRKIKKDEMIGTRRGLILK